MIFVLLASKKDFNQSSKDKGRNICVFLAEHTAFSSIYSSKIIYSAFGSIRTVPGVRETETSSLVHTAWHIVSAQQRCVE